MKVIERWYEKLLGYDWFDSLCRRFTFVEIVIIVAAIALILDFIIRGDV